MIVEEYTFLKKDDSLRTITGTRDFKAMQNDPDFIKPKGVRKSAAHVTSVWDLVSKSWKCFITANLIVKRYVYKNNVDVRVENNDFYNKKSTVPTILKKNKTPFFVLSLLNTVGSMDEVELINGVYAVKGKVQVAKNIERTVARVLKAFMQNGLVKKFDNKYKLTSSGKQFIYRNVERGVLQEVIIMEKGCKNKEWPEDKIEWPDPDWVLPKGGGCTNI